MTRMTTSAAVEISFGFKTTPQGRRLRVLLWLSRSVNTRLLAHVMLRIQEVDKARLCGPRLPNGPLPLQALSRSRSWSGLKKIHIALIWFELTTFRLAFRSANHYATAAACIIYFAFKSSWHFCLGLDRRFPLGNQHQHRQHETVVRNNNHILGIRMFHWQCIMSVNITLSTRICDLYKFVRTGCTLVLQCLA